MRMYASAKIGTNLNCEKEPCPICGSNRVIQLSKNSNSELAFLNSVPVNWYACTKCDEVFNRPIEKEV